MVIMVWPFTDQHNWSIQFLFVVSVVQEITLWRKGDIVRKSMSHQAAIASQRFEGSASAERAIAQAREEED